MARVQQRDDRVPDSPRKDEFSPKKSDAGSTLQPDWRLCLAARLNLILKHCDNSNVFFFAFFKKKNFVLLIFIPFSSGI